MCTVSHRHWLRRTPHSQSQLTRRRLSPSENTELTSTEQWNLRETSRSRPSSCTTTASLSSNQRTSTCSKTKRFSSQRTKSLPVRTESRRLCLPSHTVMSAAKGKKKEKLLLSTHFHLYQFVCTSC